MTTSSSSNSSKECNKGITKHQVNENESTTRSGGNKRKQLDSDDDCKQQNKKKDGVAKPSTQETSKPSSYTNNDSHRTETSTAENTIYPSSQNSASVTSSRPLKTHQCHTNTLFVGGLHPRITDAHLHKLFQPYGSIQRVFQCTHKEGPYRGQLKGYAFVEYTSVESARTAIGKIDGLALLGKKLVVRPAHDKMQAVGATSEQGSAGNGRRMELDLRKEKSEIENKITAVKRAIEEKKQKQKQQGF